MNKDLAYFASIKYFVNTKLNTTQKCYRPYLLFIFNSSLSSILGKSSVNFIIVFNHPLIFHLDNLQIYKNKNTTELKSKLLEYWKCLNTIKN